jgi:ATP-dependent DNA helicase RecG
MDLATPLRFVKGVGPARAEALSQSGFETVGDILYHLPFRYEDRRRIGTVAAVKEPGWRTLQAKLKGVRVIRTRRRGLTIVRGLADDGTAAIPVMWFNRPYLANQVVEGQEYLLHGQVRDGKAGLELLNPTCEKADEAIHSARIVPIYPSAGKLGPAALRRILSDVLSKVDFEREVPDPLPPELLRRYSLPQLQHAIPALHAPPDSEDVFLLNSRRSPYHQRLIYGEFFELQLELALLRATESRERKGHSYTIDDRVRALAREVLPFKLTGAQKKALREIADELRGPYPMLRLLQGDVGSGKTIVAALAHLLAIESGLQGAFMAPTEILAEQHFANLQRLLGSRYRIALFTGSAGPSAADRRALARGEVHLAVGTHALIQEGIQIHRLGLAVIDEQHRFGVAQRQILQKKGERPDVLVMTATPIPRSLALTAYGDLELSVLDELPPGRTPIQTDVLATGKRREVYERLRAELDAGAQAYIVFPLIEESEEIEAASVEAMGERVREFLDPGSATKQILLAPKHDPRRRSTAILHGRIPAPEREKIMRAFADGEIRVLISTTVIEVGVDVPQATWMVIESAERFGLAQLHQLRGRVGRGTRASRCIALHGRLSEEGERRLEVFAATTDGFRIAEADLEIRGPGDLLGTRQAGIPTFRVANIVTDREWLERARADAREILPRLADPEFAGLRARVEPRARSRYEKFAGG